MQLTAGETDIMRRHGYESLPLVLALDWPHSDASSSSDKLSCTWRHLLNSVCWWQLALRFLVKHAQEGQTVLDYGTGSGVCGLAAIKLGCSKCLGVDIDDEV